MNLTALQAIAPLLRTLAFFAAIAVVMAAMSVECWLPEKACRASVSTCSTNTPNVKP